MILRYRLEKFHKALVFQILWQTPSFVKTRDLSLLLPREEVVRRFRFERPGVPLTVATESCPEMTTSELFLRGQEPEESLKVCIKYFSNNHDRDLYFKKIQRSLSLWACEWRTWAPESGILEASEEELKEIPSTGRFFELHKG